MSVYGRENRPVAANTNAITRVKTCAKLAYDDISSPNDLPITALYATILCI
jgi:hypothetical protein